MFLYRRSKLGYTGYKKGGSPGKMSLTGCDNSSLFNNSNSTGVSRSCSELTSKYFNNKVPEKLKRNIKKQNVSEKKLKVEDVERYSPSKSYEPLHEEEKDANANSAGSPEESGLLRFKDDFFEVQCENLARSLLGKTLVRKLENGTVLSGRIVETECYLGVVDKASHTFGGKRTERNAPMFMKPGTSYIYLTYGMYHCFNISSQGDGAAVLLRALEPLEGVEFMTAQRLRGVKKTPAAKKSLKLQELCNGPAKLCIAMDMTRDNCNMRDLSSWPGLSVRPGEGAWADPVPDSRVVVTKRVGIESAGPEWADKPLRFYILGSTFVSKRDKIKEKELELTSQ